MNGKKAVVMYLFKNGNPGSRILNIMTNATERLCRKGVRVVPGASARYGSLFQACIMMPSYVNIGAYVDAGTWLTYGQQ
jgi:2,3,4,5-tetrahydropyridine-2-carboxylate N-succinyltransferase